jgi:ABC-2 type transport system ATP-binding protein
MPENKHPPASQPIIQVTNLTKDFGSFRAVDHISFEVSPGEIFGFLGPNGSGKTTSIRMMLGLLTPTEGQAVVLGKPVSDQGIELRKQIGYMSQKFSLYNDLTVMQNLNFYGLSYGLSNTELVTRIQEAIEMAGLEGKENTLTKELAGGWRQRLALNAAILHRPQLLFLDEPTAGVDPLSRRAFWDLLYQQASFGTTIFVTTHYMDEAEHCHRLAFIQHGKIIAEGSPQQIKREEFPWSVLELAPKNPVTAIKTLIEARDAGNLVADEIELYGSFIHVITKNPKKTMKQIKRQIGKKAKSDFNVVEIPPTLEDVFISTMKRLGSKN